MSSLLKLEPRGLAKLVWARPSENKFVLDRLWMMDGSRCPRVEKLRSSSCVGWRGTKLVRPPRRKRGLEGGVLSVSLIFGQKWNTVNRRGSLDCRGPGEMELRRIAGADVGSRMRTVIRHRRLLSSRLIGNVERIL